MNRYELLKQGIGSRQRLQGIINKINVVFIFILIVIILSVRIAKLKQSLKQC